MQSRNPNDAISLCLPKRYIPHCPNWQRSKGPPKCPQKQRLVIISIEHNDVHANKTTIYSTCMVGPCSLLADNWFWGFERLICFAWSFGSKKSARGSWFKRLKQLTPKTGEPELRLNHYWSYKSFESLFHGRAGSLCKAFISNHTMIRDQWFCIGKLVLAISFSWKLPQQIKYDSGTACFFLGFGQWLFQIDPWIGSGPETDQAVQAVHNVNWVSWVRLLQIVTRIWHIPPTVVMKRRFISAK